LPKTQLFSLKGSYFAEKTQLFCRENAALGQKRSFCVENVVFSAENAALGPKRSFSAETQL
jgi:hypothetical protein